MNRSPSNARFVSRGVAFPLVAAVVLACALTAWVSFFALLGEFEHAAWTGRDGSRLTLALRHGYPMIWALPAISLVAAVDLLRRSRVPLARLAWFLSGFILAMFVWLVFVGLALALVYVQRSHSV